MVDSEKELPLFGFLNIYKPKGVTSHDVVSFMRKVTKIRQIGHTGTLDPFAEGVLPVCIGKATRLIEYLDGDKEYLATIQFGANTDSYDLDGHIVDTYNKKVTKDDVTSALTNFSGEISQLPPIYSAIKVNGKKLYDYARAGVKVEIQPRNVFIEKIEMKDFCYETQQAVVLIKCSKGTYIRSIAFDLGKLLECGGYLVKLIRTQSGKFLLESTVSLDKCKENYLQYLINPINMINLPMLEISEDDLKKIKNGNPIVNKSLKTDGFVVLVYNSEIKAVAQYDGMKVIMKKVF